MKRHGQRPQINIIRGQQFGVTVALKKKQPAAEAVEACECDITGIFWENSETGEFDQTALNHDFGGGGSPG